jgi:hypothetical protein
MARTVKVKAVKQTPIEDRIEGCVLIPVSQGKSHYPRAADGVLDNTYYRVVKDTDIVRAFVTVMPDGNRVAWDSCAKCYQHIRNCPCKEGAYHSRSIAWIRATCDVKYPSERVTDYSMYYDPWGRNTGKPIDRPTFGQPMVSSTTKRKKASPPPADIPAVVQDDPNALSVADIKNIDMSELQREAEKQAKRSVRRARSVIRGGKK